MSEILLHWVTPAELEIHRQKYRLTEWLTCSELRLLARFRSPRRQRDWLAGRLAAKQLLQRSWLGAQHASPLRDFLKMEILQDADGAPELHMTQRKRYALALSIAHSAGHALAAVGRSSMGVDLELTRLVRADLARRILSKRESAHASSACDLLVFWTLKEAARKAHRRRPLPPFREIEVRQTDGERAEIAVQKQRWHSQWGRRGEFVWACVWG